MITVALAGLPTSGKSFIINTVTGKRYRETGFGGVTKKAAIIGENIRCKDEIKDFDYDFKKAKYNEHR